jgi:hypothetical protein
LEIHPVPEPITLSLFGAGLACVAVMHRRRKLRTRTYGRFVR